MSVSNFVTRILNFVVIILFVSMTVILTASILSRSIQPFISAELNIQIPWSEEFIKYAVLWICWLGAALVVHEKGHFALNLLSRKYPDSRILSFCLYLSTTILAAVFIYYGTAVCINMSIQKTPSLQISKTFVNMVVPITGVLMVFYTLIELRNRRKGGS